MSEVYHSRYCLALQWTMTTQVPSTNMQPTVINGQSLNISLQKNICDEMSLKIAAFQQRQGKWITANCQCIQDGDVHYYGIHKHQQMQRQDGLHSIELTRQLYQEMKSVILQNMKLSPDTKAVQVVGDSATFSNYTFSNSTPIH